MDEVTLPQAIGEGRVYHDMNVSANVSEFWWRPRRRYWRELFNRTSRPSARSIPSILSVTVEMGTFMHACEGDMLYESTNPKIPYFNAPIYLENKVQSYA